MWLKYFLFVTGEKDELGNSGETTQSASDEQAGIPGRTAIYPWPSAMIQRRGNRKRAREAGGPIAFEYIWLRNLALTQCRGCAVCVGNGEEFCPIRDDVPAIMQTMREEDGIALASPVYSWQVSGLLKVLIDRLSYTLHRPQLYGKKVLVLVTGMLGTNNVEDYLTEVAQFWGAEIVATAGLITPPTVSARQQTKNGRILARAVAAFNRAPSPDPSGHFHHRTSLSSIVGRPARFSSDSASARVKGAIPIGFRTSRSVSSAITRFCVRQRARSIAGRSSECREFVDSREGEDHRATMSLWHGCGTRCGTICGTFKRR